MAATTLVCTTLTGTPPLMPGGEKLYARQAQIRAVVLRRLGEQHAHLLAEPQALPGEDRVAWASPVPGIVRPLAALPAAVRDSVRAECDMLLADIERTAATLETGTSGDGQLAGSLLRMAIQRPSDDHLFLVGNQPVLACWGCSPAEAGAVLPGSPKAVGSASLPVSPPAKSVPRAEAAAPSATNPGARWLMPTEDAPVRATAATPGFDAPRLA